MADAPEPLLLKLPTSPYPGLRPFLDHEDMLMNGRQAQVEDIVARLGPARRQPNRAQEALADDAPPATRFVAVIGGSGSGKSSLIRAGVVPYLRQYGIPSAGDLWEIVVATPGTNFQPDADGLVHESPITRLARKFERVLRGPHDASRCDAIEQALRRPGGLGRMVELFGAELNLPDGLQPDKACVLLVIDQFEELFHKSNLGRPDAAQLVERVIDHYHQAKVGCGHDRCYLAITMRSEHLNDCAGYLGLPEAINAGSYLVSRLDEAQLREVIEKPAQRFLRLRQRERQVLLRHAPETDAASLPALPPAVVFEDGVVDRLVADARRIANDPDHLPLLQHALARTWEAACARHGLPESGVPTQILLVDLWRAARAAGDAPLPATDNLLQLSLDRWAQATLDGHPAEQQVSVLELLRRLTYKDTRTGTYNQQRLYVAHHPLGEQGLHAMLKGKWIDGVDYLYWDDEDPQRVTLKVSHESFIRGWKTLRKLANDEADRLEQYIELLAATRSWLDHGRQERDLLEGRLLARLADARIEDAIGPIDAGHDADAETPTWHDWQGWLAQVPRGAPLQTLGRLDVRDCVRRSRDLLDRRERAAREQHDNEIKALAEADKARAEASEARARADAADAMVKTEQAEARATKMRQLGRLRIGGLILFGTSLVASFAGLVLVPVTIRAQHYFQAAGLANEVVPSLAQEQIGGSLPDLGKLIKAAEQIRLANEPSATDEPWTAMTAGLADGILSLPLLWRLNLASLLTDAEAAIAPVVNRHLRQVLTQSLWLAKQDGIVAEALITGGSTQPMRCADGYGELMGLVTLEGGAGVDAEVRRGVFVADQTSTGGGQPASRPIFTATVSRQAGRTSCKLGKLLHTLPPHIDMLAKPAALLLDAELSHLMITAPAGRADAASADETVQVLRLNWRARGDNNEASLTGPLAVLTRDPEASAHLRLQAQADRSQPGAPGASWYTTGGQAMRVGPQAWQLVSASARRLLPAPTGLLALKAPNSGPGCPEIAARIQVEFKDLFDKNKLPDEVFEPLDQRALTTDDGHCLLLQRSHLHGPDQATGSAASALLDQVSLQVFSMPAAADRDAQGRLAKTRLVASLEFGRARHGDDQWKTGVKASAWDGWLILERQADDKNPVQYFGLPWSTTAMAKLADGLRLSHCAALPAGDRAAKLPAECAPDWPLRHPVAAKGE